MEDISVALREGNILNNRYQIKKVLGIGGFGISYEVVDVKPGDSCGKHFAIKEYFPKDLAVRMPDTGELLPASLQYKDTFEHGMERFLEEAELLEKLNDVPGVVNVYDFFIQNGTCYFLMEMLYGKTLNKIRRDYGGRVNWEQLAPVIKKAGEALSAVHAKGIFHRDAGPDNIFLLADGNIKLIDFGNSKNLTRKDGEKLSVYLKPGFAPPEQYSSSSKQGTYTDVYTLAATIYYMLAGKKLPDPFTIQANGYMPLTQLGVNQRVADAVDRALVLRPQDRTQTIDEFMYNLGLKQRDGSSAQLVPFLIVRINGKVTDRYRLNVNTTYKIGRVKETSNIVINEDFISRVHCEIFYDTLSNEYYIVDHSSNGTYFGNTRLEKEKIRKVRLGSFLFLGGPKCQVELGAMYA
ncbi:MAG: FHA domain-containing protein [Eubacterium sp.]|nr:FHA domain-containing protein [Eubacterium sp.]